MNIAVFCGSWTGENDIWIKAAEELGNWIGEKGHTLVYGGGGSGLMGVIASKVYGSGGQVIGVVPEDVDFIRNRPHDYVTKLIYTKDMSDRNKKMFETADAFIALPGGVGTLDEISEAITLTKIGVMDKKSVLFNRKGFYDPLRALFYGMEKEGFMTAESMSHVMFSDDLKEIER